MRAIAIMALCLLAGCNTMNGMGEDMQAAGANLSASSQRPPQPPPPEVMSYPETDELPPNGP